MNWMKLTKIKKGNLIEYLPRSSESRQDIVGKKFIFFVIDSNDHSFTHFQNGKIYLKFIHPEDHYNIIQ
jgi:hypothetical protein